MHFIISKREKRQRKKTPTTTTAQNQLNVYVTNAIKITITFFRLIFTN
jgi:hypothetical protein